MPYPNADAPDPTLPGTTLGARSAVWKALRAAGPDAPIGELFRRLTEDAVFRLPLPGSGRTLARWQVLSEIAAHDLSLVKLFESHADALSILHELGDRDQPTTGARWGVWAAEPPGARVTASASHGSVRLHGSKQWCSGAGLVTHALLTAWTQEGAGPYLVAVDLREAPMRISRVGWHAVGMAASDSLDVSFDGAIGHVVGRRAEYVARPGFMQGGAGIAACWFGGAVAIAEALHRALADGPDAIRAPFRLAALGKVELALVQTAALLRETAGWIDEHPRADASLPALRARQSADDCARVVLDEVGRALGATPFCRDRRFARMAADLPVFTRQGLAERDFAVLGERRLAAGDHGWRLGP